QHQTYPLDVLVNDLNLVFDKSRNPLFDVIVMQQNNVETYKDQFREILVSKYEEELQSTSQFDLLFNFEETDNSVSFSLIYNTDLFKDSTISRISKQLLLLLKGILEKPKEPLSRIGLFQTDKINLYQRLKARRKSEYQKTPLSYHQERIWFINEFEEDYLYEGFPVYHNIP